VGGFITRPLKIMYETDIEKVFSEFKSKLDPNHRYASFDYCYNYFLSTDDLKADVEKSCLTLGFYLASWGMFRGSSFLLQKSAKVFQPTIDYVSKLDRSVWKIDVDNYNETNIATIIEIYKGVKGQLIHEGNADLTLVTKILLGVFGFVPAFDNFFCRTFRQISNGQCGFRRVNAESLGIIRDFYEANRTTIDGLANRTFTTDFITGKETGLKYPKAKIIDMYGFTARLDQRPPRTLRTYTN
jgi:hypothetical protein